MSNLQFPLYTRFLCLIISFHVINDSLKVHCTRTLSHLCLACIPKWETSQPYNAVLVPTWPPRCGSVPFFLEHEKKIFNSPIRWFRRIASISATFLSQRIGRVIVGHRLARVSWLLNRRLSDSSGDWNYWNLFKLKRTLCLLARCCLHGWSSRLCSGRKNYVRMHIHCCAPKGDDGTKKIFCE